MAVLYIKEQEAFVQKNGEKIMVTKNSRRLLEAPVSQLENIAVLGNVQISTPALHMLMENGVDVSYLSYGGKYLGSTAAEASKNIFLRFEQYQFYLDDKRRIEMAKIITANKIANQIELLKEHKRKDVQYDWNRDIVRMEKIRQTLTEKSSANEVLGVEGMCSNIYFGAFGHMLDCEFEFHGRNRRPPRDPVNIMISLAYTLLTKEVSNALDAESFEPYLGFLHGIRYGRKSLALDMVEEFRQPAVDRLILMLFNKRMIQKGDFEEAGEGKILLSEDGFQKFCHEYERWMSGRSSLAGEKSFRSAIRQQVADLKRSIREKKTYEPYSWKDHTVRHQL